MIRPSKLQIEQILRGHVTITIKQISAVEFLKFQRDIWDSYMGEDEPYVPCYRKGWESKYDPKFSKGQGTRDTRRVMPLASSLPAKRWVVAREPEGSLEERSEHWQELDAWLADKKVKFQKCQVAIEGVPTWVHLFKKANDALMFKLTWG